ncbi:hypothetical protein ACKWTF_015124 [Chironomus riparius]
MKRSNSDDFNNSEYAAKKKQRLSSEMYKIVKYFEPINEVIEISDDDERELSPADSGFKEPSTSSSSSLKHIPITSRKPLSEQSLPNRGSSRIQKLQEEEQKLTQSEKILRQTLKYQNLIHPLESTATAISRYNPQVNCRILTKYEITKRVQLGKIIPKVQEFPADIKFQGLILHQWRNYDRQHSHFFVRWIPVNILDDEWVIADHAKATKLKKTMKLSELNTRQRRRICEMIFKGLKI